MAARGSPAHRSADPMRGILRDLSRRVGKLEGKPGRRGPAGPPGERGPQGSPEQDGAAAVAAVVETGEDGRAVWVFPVPFDSPPVISATPVDPVPDDIFTVVAAIEQVDAEQVVVRVWQTLLPAEPVGASLLVHLTAHPMS